MPGLTRRVPMDGGGGSCHLQHHCAPGSGGTMTISPPSTSAVPLASHGFWLASAAMAVSVVKGWTSHCHRSIAANVSTHVRSIGAVRRGAMKVLEVCRCVGPDPTWCVGSVERTGWRAHATDASPALRGRYLDTARACRGRDAFTRSVWRERLLVAAVRYGTHCRPRVPQMCGDAGVDWNVSRWPKWNKISLPCTQQSP